MSTPADEFPFHEHRSGLACRIEVVRGLDCHECGHSLVCGGCCSNDLPRTPDGIVAYLPGGPLTHEEAERAYRRGTAYA